MIEINPEMSYYIGSRILIFVILSILNYIDHSVLDSPGRTKITNGESYIFELTMLSCIPIVGEAIGLVSLGLIIISLPQVAKGK